MTQSECIEELRSKLTERALESPALDRKLSIIANNAQLCHWLETIPTIPDSDDEDDHATHFNPDFD
jgi:hypothetical protein